MNVEAIAAVTEGKITRAELVELAIENLRSKLYAEREALVAKMTEQRGVKITLKQAFALLKTVTPKVVLEKRREHTWINGSKWEWLDKGYSLKIEAELPLDAAVPAFWLKAVQTFDELKTQKAALDQQIGKLTGGAKQARVELIKQALEQSPAGQKVLAAIDTLRADVHSKLLGTGAAK